MIVISIMIEIPEADRLAAFPHPREVPDLYGQKAAEDALFEAFMSGRMHHAWLLAGPKGVGKATLAYRLARFVLKYGTPDRARALGAEGIEVPAADPVFRQVASLGHPDLAVLRRPYDEKTKRIKTVIPVEEVRRATGMFSKSAGAGGWRVCLVDAADDMNVNAANALLKILEEPPAQGLFIVVSHQPGRLLPTIRSRCRKLAVAPLDQDDIVRVLAANAAVPNADEAAAIAQLAEGSAGRALEIAAGGGLDLYREMVGLIAPLPRLDVAALHALADKAGRRGADQVYATLMEMLQDWLVRLVRRGAGPASSAETGAAEIVEGEGAAMGRLAGAASLDRWVEVWEKIGQSAVRAEALNMDRKLVILNAFSMLESAAAGAPVRA